jgi:Zinc-binding dehydrogenase/Glutamine amidotransferase domain
MCGITGWVSFDRDLSRDPVVIDAMTETMACRGPDAEGVWSDRHAALGHRRLAVIDLPGGAQPMSVSTPNGDVVMVYSAKGQRFQTVSDTEVVLRGYLQWGEALAERLNGMYALIAGIGQRRLLGTRSVAKLSIWSSSDVVGPRNRLVNAPAAMASPPTGRFTEQRIVKPLLSRAAQLAITLQFARFCGRVCATAVAGRSERRAGRVEPEVPFTMGSNPHPLAVVAAGGVGLAIVQMAKAFGASQIIAVDVRQDKLEAAVCLGATDVVDAQGQDPVEAVREFTGGRGADIAFEVLGNPKTLEQAFQMTASGGSTVLVGVGAPDASASILLQSLLRRQIRLVGSYGGRPRSDMPLLLRMAASGQLDLGATITSARPLSDIEAVYRCLNAGDVVGRIVMGP